MSTNVVDIKNVDKVALLHELWSGMKPAVFFAAHPSMIPSFDADKARDAVGDYIDYFDGRCIKTDISKDTADPRLYDRDAGAGAFARAVARVRAVPNGVPVKPSPPPVLKCPDGSGNTFVPFADGKPMVPGKEGTILCGNCPYWQQQHRF
jgi:hypothetical protein